MTVQNIKTKKSVKGFTLIELLVVIGILAILLAITLIAINPAKQFGQANDTKRRSAVTQILNAVGAYVADTSATGGSGSLPAGIPTAPAAAKEISDDAVTGVDLCPVLVPNYIPALPVDPASVVGGVDQIPDTCPAGYLTGYFIVQDASGRVTVSAPDAYAGTTAISVTR